MLINTIDGGSGHSAVGTPAIGLAGFCEWRVRPSAEAVSSRGGLFAADVPMTYPAHASASERCP